MGEVFVISDTHFGHHNIIKFDATRAFRPFATIEEHDQELVRRWNNVVSNKDVVYHLGDVYFGQKNSVILGELRGIKKLVLGNHDYYSLDIYKQYFSKIFGATSFSEALLTHVPVHPTQLEHRFKMNIHGHMHASKLDDPRYVCVAVEHTGLAPIPMEQALRQGSHK